MGTRLYVLQVQDSGAVTAPIQIGNIPNCLGWELSFNVQLGGNMLPGWTATVQDEWQNSPPGVTYNALAASMGGKVFIPYPSLSIFAQDFIAAAVGATTAIRIVARPVIDNGWSAASSKVLGVVAQQGIAPAAAAVFNLPAMAIGYKVTTNQSGPNRVSMLDPFGGEMSFWEIGNPSTSNFDEGGQTWRECGPPGSTISVVNGGAVAALITLWTLFDFRRSR